MQEIKCPLCGKGFEQIERSTLFGKRYSVGCPDHNCGCYVGHHYANDAESAWVIAREISTRVTR